MRVRYSGHWASVERVICVPMGSVQLGDASRGGGRSSCIRVPVRLDNLVPAAGFGPSSACQCPRGIRNHHDVDINIDVATHEIARFKQHCGIVY